MGKTGEWCQPSGVKFARSMNETCGVKNFSWAFIEGSTNHRTNSVVDHATSYQHEAATIGTKEGNLPADNYY